MDKRKELWACETATKDGDATLSRKSFSGDGMTRWKLAKLSFSVGNLLLVRPLNLTDNVVLKIYSNSLDKPLDFDENVNECLPGNIRRSLPIFLRERFFSR